MYRDNVISEQKMDKEIKAKVPEIEEQLEAEK